MLLRETKLLFDPIIELLRSGAHLSGWDIEEELARQFNLTADERKQMNPKGKKLSWTDNVAHALKGLTNAKIIDSELKTRRAPNGGRRYVYFLREERQVQAPTHDLALLESRVQKALSRMEKEGDGIPPPPPPGSENVPQVFVNTTRFQRDPEVYAWVRRRANGGCEVCGKRAPFQDCNDVPFLEVHHVRPLADGGPDKVDNAVAACPNCHRELHHGVTREALRNKVIAKIAMLKDYPSVRSDCELQYCL